MKWLALAVAFLLAGCEPNRKPLPWADVIPGERLTIGVEGGKTAVGLLKCGDTSGNPNGFVLPSVGDHVTYLGSSESWARCKVLDGMERGKVAYFGFDHLRRDRPRAPLPQ